jgi:hypothetical protein
VKRLCIAASIAAAHPQLNVLTASRHITAVKIAEYCTSTRDTIRSVPPSSKRRLLSSQNPSLLKKLTTYSLTGVTVKTDYQMVLAHTPVLSIIPTHSTF